MPYVKIEDGIFRNPKVVQVSSHAKLIYIASICYCGSALTDGFVPTNTVRSLAAEAGLSFSKKVAIELVASGLWSEADGGYHVHDYLSYNESAAKVQAKKDAARERMNKRRSPDVRANNERSSRNVREPTTDTTTDTTTSSDEEEPPIPPEGDDSGDEPQRTGGKPILSGVQQERFDRWYAAYPQKREPLAAARAWSKIKPLPDDAMTDRMIAKVEEWAGSFEWAKEGGQFIPYPATWLNKGRWDDGPPTEQSKTPDGSMRIVGGKQTTAERNAAAFAEYKRRTYGDDAASASETDSDSIETTGRMSS